MPRLPNPVFTLLVNVISRSALIPKRVRRVLLRTAGVRIGQSSVSSGCFLGSPNLAIGDNSFINVDVFFDGLGSITIGDGVHVAMGAMIVTGSHELGGPERRGGSLLADDVVIGDGVWIGARAVVLSGVTIGNGTVVAAGAVVTSDCEPNSLYAGVPARLVRRLDDDPATVSR